MIIDTFRAHGLTGVHTAVYEGRQEELDGYLRAQPRRIGACVMVKLDMPWAAQACRAHNGTVVLDCVDNVWCFRQRELRKMRVYDQVLVQTSVHRDWLRSHKIPSSLLPYPHGNVGPPLPPPRVRAVLESVAFLYSDRFNLPNASQLHLLCQAAAGAGMSLLYVRSPSVKSYRVHCGANLSLPSGQEGGAFPDWRDDWCDRLPPPPVSPSERTGVQLPPAVLEELSQRGNQSLYYTSPKAQLLRNSFDVGLIWPPKLRFGAFADSQRPPTRFHFWMAHGVPVVGYPMQAYTEAADRTGYPRLPVNVSSAALLTETLLLVRPAKAYRSGKLGCGGRVSRRLGLRSARAALQHERVLMRTTAGQHRLR
jgi:hypothetical protein